MCGVIVRVRWERRDETDAIGLRRGGMGGGGPFGWMWIRSGALGASTGTGICEVGLGLELELELEAEGVEGRIPISVSVD